MRSTRMRRAMAHISPINQPWVAMSTWRFGTAGYRNRKPEGNIWQSKPAYCPNIKMSRWNGGRLLSSSWAANKRWDSKMSWYENKSWDKKYKMKEMNTMDLKDDELKWHAWNYRSYFRSQFMLINNRWLCLNFFTTHCWAHLPFCRATRIYIYKIPKIFRRNLCEKTSVIWCLLDRRM